MGLCGAADVFPAATWETRPPESVGLSAAKLDAFRDFVGGRGCVVRHGYMVYAWGDQALRGNVYSACKPWFSHFLFKAVEEGKIPSLDQKVNVWEPRLNDLNPALGFKDRDITWRHLANQNSCYGVKDKPGAAFNYNDYQMALFWDTLFVKVYGATYDMVDAKILHPQLTDILQCQDNPTFMAMGTNRQMGLLGVSVRDFARFGLLYLHHGNWNGRQLISAEHVEMAVTSPLPGSLPDSTEELAEMIPGQRTIGRVARPQKQGQHGGSYSWLWWVNGVDRAGKRRWPDAPVDTYGAFGKDGNAMVVIPSRDLVVSWSSPKLDELAAQREAFKRLVESAAVERSAEALTPPVGPRGAVGPDVPLHDAEKTQFADRLAVEGRSTAAVQAGCERAIKEGVRVVFLPAGDYVFEATVRVPGGLTLLGEGSKTLIRTKDRTTHVFRVDGDKVRFTRLKMHGADTTASQNNDTYGISAGGKKDVRVDHCELLGFSYATTFGDEATAHVDHCSIHHNLRDGLGYGVAIYSGAYVLASENEFSQNRHSLASNGALDWSSGKRLGKFVHQSGVRKTHWEFLRNRVGSNDQSPNELCAVDTHPGMDGTFVVESNLFEDLRHGIGIRDGSGLIRGNVFRNLRGKPFRPFIAISISYGQHNGIPVENAMPHNIDVRENTFVNAGDQVFVDGVLKSESGRAATAVKYVVGQAENITVEGKLVPETRNERGPSPPIPRLQEMDQNGLLR